MIYILGATWFVFCFAYISKQLQSDAKLFTLLILLMTLVFAGGMMTDNYRDSICWQTDAGCK